MEWAGYNSFYYCDHLFFSGEPLESVFHTQEQYLAGLLSRHQSLQSTYLNIWRRLVEKIHRPTWQVAYSFGEVKEQTDEDVLAQLLEIGNKMFLFAYYLANGMLLFFREDFEGAISYLKSAGDNATGVVGMLTNAQYCFYYSLALLCDARERKYAKNSEQLLHVEELVRTNQLSLHNFAKHAPSNFQHKVIIFLYFFFYCFLMQKYFLL